MLSVLQTSLTGLLSATNRAKLAANNILQATARGAEAVEAATAASGSRAYDAAVTLGPGSATPRPPATYSDRQTGYGGGDENTPDLAQSIVDLKLAAHAYKANAAVLRTADEILGSLLDDLS